MKKIIIFTLFLLLVFTSTTFAHTYLKASNPTDGQIVDGTLNELTLQFDSAIDGNSLVTLTNEEGKEIPVSNSVNNDTLFVKFTSPLESGTYTVSYNIIGEDGHPMSGSYLFMVNSAESAEGDTQEESNEGSTFNWFMIIIGALVIIIVLSLFTKPNNRRRRRY